MSACPHAPIIHLAIRTCTTYACVHLLSEHLWTCGHVDSSAPEPWPLSALENSRIEPLESLDLVHLLDWMNAHRQSIQIQSTRNEQGSNVTFALTSNSLSMSYPYFLLYIVQNAIL